MQYLMPNGAIEIESCQEAIIACAELEVIALSPDTEYWYHLQLLNLDEQIRHDFDLPEVIRAMRGETEEERRAKASSIKNEVVPLIDKLDAESIYDLAMSTARASLIEELARIIVETTKLKTRDQVVVHIGQRIAAIRFASERDGLKLNV